MLRPFCSNEPMQVFRLIKQGIQVPQPSAFGCLRMPEYVESSRRCPSPSLPRVHGQTSYERYSGRTLSLACWSCYEEPSERLPMRRGGIHNIEDGSRASRKPGNIWEST